MGFFSNLFEKKTCAFCGGDIGLFGNRKLEDGNMCKECAEKLSPWFDERRHSTVEQIGQQLEYREANKAKVAAFNITRTLGGHTKVHIDEDAGVFVVTSAGSLMTANPDVIALADVTGVSFDVTESTEEITQKSEDGTEVSYDPPRYTHNFDFYITVSVNNPYFNEMGFRLNSSSVEIDDPEPAKAPAGASRTFGEFMSRAAASVNAAKAAEVKPEDDPEYRKYYEMGEGIKAALLQGSRAARG